MFARKSVVSPAGRATVFATVAALALTAVAPSVATAAPRSKGVSAAASDATDFSARRRVAVRRGGGGAAAAAAFAGIVGTGLAIAATQNRRAYYDDHYGYGGPVYVAPSPYYGGYGYGPNW
jgi:hypothetical protein